MNRILLVDDEPDILRVLGISLRADGYDVQTASSGEEALAIFTRETPELVLTDIKMPGMNGIEVLREVKKLSDETEVIIITGHGDIDSAVEALHYGASDFINKPVRDKQLAIALKRAREKIRIKRQLREYTTTLEHKIEAATREIRRRSNFQAKLIRSSNDGIVATDEKLKIVIYNPGAEKIFGYPHQHVLDRMQIQELYTPEIADLFVSGVTKENAARDFSWQETSILSATGDTIPVRFSGSILHEKDREMGSVAFFQDLREIKRLERELLKAERLAAVGQTVAGLAHGLKNILHGLKGGSYLVDLGIKKDDTAKLKSGWDMIKRNIGRTSELVLDLLTYSKEREPEFQDCYPNDVAGEVADLLSEKAREGRVAIKRLFDPSISCVSMDPRIIHSALLNLMTNAIDACLFDEDTHKKWQVAIASRLEGGNTIGFEVSDNGAGMSQEVQDRLFTSFFSTKGHRGTGLGLMVTRKLVEEHGGWIEVASTLGEGTSFTVHLPFEAAGETQANAGC
ncbi:MAG: response regulator [Desulfobacterales bacterium]